MTISMMVKKRDVDKSNLALRSEGKLPAIVYGPNFQTESIELEAKTFEGVLKTAGESTIIDLEGLQKPVQVLIKQVDFNPIKQSVQHVDFYVITKGKEITANVPLVFVGEAPAADLGNITEVHREVPVTCDPSKLPQHIDVDVSGLISLEDKILVSDLKVPKGVKIDLDQHEPIVVVSEVKLETDEGMVASDGSDVEKS